MRVFLAAIIAGCAACSSRFPDVPLNRGLQSLRPNAVIDIADGTRTIAFVATVDRTALALGQSITFTTTVGSFSPSGTTITVPVDAADSAVAQLRAPADTSAGMVIASMGGVSASTPVTFLKAPPTGIEIAESPPILVAGPNSNVVLTVTLTRDTGSPSPGFVVHFSSDSSSHCVGTFGADSIVEVNDTVRVGFAVADTLCEGTVTVHVFASRGSDSTQTFSRAIPVVQPPPPSH